MKQKKVGYIIAGVFVLAIVAYFIFSRNDKSQQITVRVKKGTFPIEVTTTGELFAKSSEKIHGPQGLGQMQIYSVKILKLVQEGTKVDSGDFVAVLDQSELTSKMKEIESNRDKALTQLTQRQLDSSLNLRRLRDDQINLKYDVEQKKTIKEQSIYEPTATKKQADIDVEKAQRALEQAKKSYELQYRKEVANMDDAKSTYSQAQQKLEQMEDRIKHFTIFAPKKGMVIYTRDWNGRQQEGSSVNTWGEFTIAELPDLSKMISRTYVNEIDISKVKVGQEVRIGIDAFPDKKFTGKVTQVANVGEQLPNSNAKVFEVNILINEFDSILRPSMTSKNTIITASINDVMFAPIEAVISNDTVTYVFKKDGARIIKQQVIAGESNDNEIILKTGVKENDELLLLQPENGDKMKLAQIKPDELKKYEMTPTIRKKSKPVEKPKESQKTAIAPEILSNVPKMKTSETHPAKDPEKPKSISKTSSPVIVAGAKKADLEVNMVKHDKAIGDSVVFRIQITTSPKKLSTSSEKFAKLPEVWMYQHQGMFIYTAGKANRPEALSGLLGDARKKGFPDAFIVAFQGENRITIAAAKNLISKKQK